MIQDYVNLVRHPHNTALFHAVEMSILTAQNNVPLHIHAEGLRGTGKTSILRAARSILPRIQRISGCLYNCDPAAPHCPEHAGLDKKTLAELGSEWIQMPFLEISHSAKVATVVGGIDLGKLVNTAQPEAALLPGTIAKAHRGIVFIDEINRLADTSPELADILLDVMGTKPGRLQIEDPGLPQVEITSLVTIWAASNPDEDPGPLEGIRRQLADRFDLCVGVKRPASHAALMSILRPHTRQNNPSQKAVIARLNDGLGHLQRQTIDEHILSFLATIYLDHELESLRALEAITLACKVHASLEGKDKVDRTDLVSVLPLALKHRVAPHVLADIMRLLTDKAPVVEAVKPVATVPVPEHNLETDNSSRNFLSRLFGSSRQSEEQDTKENELPLSVSAAASTASGKNRDAVIEANLANPDLVHVTAPPNAAMQLDDIVESRLVMGEVELERDK